ncbi:MAG: choice-of-anchor D domain-containing protein [Prevotella sp.]|nr:choice-of-anchor D domain-containing protein [Prevotella sp.]
MKHFFNFRKSKLLLFSLFAMLVGGVNAAWAETITLPYSYGFEDYNLSTDGWTTANPSGKNSSEFAIVGAAKKTGSYGFRFSSYSASGENTQYLISPEFDAPNGILVSFEYAASSTNGTEKFRVGYSTTDTEIENFTFGDEISYNKTAWATYNNTFPKGTKYIAIYYYANYQYRLYVDDFNFEAPEVFEGPALQVFDGENKLATDYSYNFGLAHAGTEKSFTLKNPGSESISLNIAGTNGFGVSPTTTTIAAGGETTLTVTMPSSSAEGTVTITPTTAGVDAFTINVSGTVKDPNKLFEDFSGNAKPEDWTATGNYSYNWSFTSGYASYGGYSASYAGNLTTPKLVFTAGEKFFFDAKMSSTYNATAAGMTIQTSTDGNSFSDLMTITSGEISFSAWNSFSVEIPSADVKYIRFANCIYMAIDNIYGGSLPIEPKMEVTQPVSLDFGAITENATKTFTIANTGKATLAGISVTSSNSSIFAITGAPTSLEAGASQEVTITMSATQTGALSSEITVSATDMEDVKFTVTGAVVPKGLMVVDFNDNALPEGWSNNASNKWNFADGKAYCTYAAELVTPKLQILEGDLLVITVTSYDDYDNNYLEIYGSADGSTWSEFEAKKYISRSQIPYGSYTTLIVTDFPTTTKYLKFKGYYVRIDEVAGLTYAPNLAVTKEGETISSPAIYDFGEKLNADATVTYNFANAGAGTINISNVAISGAGAAAYSTNWTESVAAPFDLVITRTYDGNRTGVQEAVVTVTTTDGDFVINVSGSDQGLNAPELSIDTTPIDFGKLVANDTKTITVTNAGTGQLSVNIASDNELFTVSPAQLADIAAGESKTFDVTFNYNDVAGNFGAKNANITVTPTYDGSSNVIISAMAYAKDPAIWSEEFTNDPTTDRGWTADAGWSFANGVAVGGGSNYLTTPYLTVNGPSDELTFEYEAKANYTLISYYISKDHGTWSSANYIPEDYATSYESLNNGDKGTITITGLEAGVYQFRFKGGNYTLDNFEGLKRFIPEHDAEISSVNIPANGYENRKYTATVSVKEKLGKEETATAKLYFGENEMATAEMALTANDETTAELSFTPNEAMNSQTAKIVVTYAGGELTSTTKSVTINPVVIYAETETNTITSGTNHIVLKRSFISGWNTICLPFQVNDPEAAFGTGIKVYAFDSYSATDGLSFSSIKLTNGMEAKTPYLLYIPETINVGDLGEIFFPNAWVSTSSPEVTKGGVTFTGTYSPMEAGMLTGNYVLTTEAKIAKAGTSASMKGFRAYFTAPAGARMIINIDGEATGIGTITTDGMLEVGAMYNLQGQKVQGAQKGLYIINGKKVVRK